MDLRERMGWTHLRAAAAARDGTCHRALSVGSASGGGCRGRLGPPRFRPPPRRSHPMVRPRFTLTRIALAGAGLLTAAGIGAATIPAALASTPAAAATSPSTAGPTPKAAPAPAAKGGANAGA